LKVGHRQSEIATVLMQIKSSVMNRSLARLDITEAASLGSAILGGIGAGIFRDILEALEGLKYGQEEILPEPAWVETYQRQYADVYQGAWEQLKPLQNKLLRLYPPMAAPP
jgi:xylulokinase